MKTLPCFMSLLLGSAACVAFAEERLPVETEQEFLDAVLLPYMEAPPKWVEKGGVREFTYENGHVWARIEVSEKTGRVKAINSNAAPFTNEVLRRMASELPELQTLELAHWGAWKYKEQFGKQDFTGAGLDAFAESRLEAFKTKGSMFGDEGAAAAARIKSLKSYADAHSQTDYAKMLPVLAENPSIEEVAVSSAFSDKFSDPHVGLLAQFPNLKRIRIDQSFFTYESGLQKLAPMKDQLESVTFWNCAVLPEDLEKLRAALPNTTIEVTPGLDEPKHQLRLGKNLEKLSGWIPPESAARFRELTAH